LGRRAFSIAHMGWRDGTLTFGGRQRYLETLDVLLLARTRDESFTYDGQYVKVPHETTVWPKPLQKPHPPLWLAGTSVESMQLAAERDMMSITTGLLGAAGVQSHLSALIQARAALGKPINDTSLGLQCITHVADTDAEAEAQLSYARWQNQAGRALARLEVKNGRVQAGPYEGELDDKGFLDRLYFGNPDTVVGKFKRAAAMGATHISNWMMFGGLEHEKIMRSIRLMGEEVIPALKDVHPPHDLYHRLAQVSPMTTEELQRARFGPAPSDVAAT